MTADDTVTHAVDSKSVVSIILDAIGTAKIPDGDLSRLSIKRMEGRTVTANCFSFSPLEIASIFDRVRKDYGPGIYEVWVLTEKKQIERRISFSVDEIHHSKSNTQNNHTNDAIGRLENKINQLNNKLNSSYNHQQNKNQNQQHMDPLSIIKMMREADDRAYDRAQKEADNRVGKDSDGDFLSRAAEFEKVAEIMGFVRSSDANRDASDPWGLAKTAETLKPEFGSLIEIVKSRMQGQPGQPGQPAGQPGQPGQAEQPGQSGAENIAELQRRTQAHMYELVVSASRGADPGLYADLTIDRFGADMVMEWLEIPGLIDQLAVQTPDVEPYKPWFKLVFDAAKETLHDELDEEPEGANTSAETDDKKMKE